MEGSDLTWDNALEIATRCENAYSENESVQSAGSDAEDGGAVAALSDQILDNQQRITNLEIAQEHMGVELEGLKASQEVMGNTIDRIAAKLDQMFPPQYDFQPHSQYAEEGAYDGGETAWWNDQRERYTLPVVFMLAGSSSSHAYDVVSFIWEMVAVLEGY